MNVISHLTHARIKTSDRKSAIRNMPIAWRSSATFG